jgi:formylglycine-generating enzyme
VSFTLDEIVAADPGGTPDDAARFLVAADWFLSQGDRAAAASSLDRAYALVPDDPHVARQRLAILDELSVREHGLVLRYVPAGAFVMGSASGDPDERPAHVRRVSAFWITDIPITWASFCALLGWRPPPHSEPPEDDPSFAEETEGVGRGFYLHEMNKIRRQYCASEEAAARDWHTHVEASRPPVTYDKKPMVAVAPADAEELGARLSSAAASYRLPTEAEWEKAARGGLSACRYAWGDALPTRELCDFDRFGEFSLRDPRELPPNGYGLHGMCGGVWEWTRDRYDALAYHRFARGDADGPSEADAAANVIRGGSWSDGAAAVTASFRSARAQDSWRAMDRLGGRGRSATPNVGFRLVRVASRAG